MKENHAHFFGSLPKEYMWKRILDRRVSLGEYKELWTQLFPDIEYQRATFAQFSKMISEAFGESSRENIQNFFLLYSLLHYLLKSKDLSGNTAFYQQGARAIANDFFSQGIESFILLVGVSNDPDEMMIKLEQISQGFEEAERHYQVDQQGYVRLTITRNRDGSIKNTSPSSLSRSLDLLDKNPQIRSRINGFDFSGEEAPSRLKPSLELLNHLLERNRHLSKKQMPQYVISIHAGENCFDFQTEDHLNAFEQLLPLDWTNLCHGTFLWIPPQLLSLSGSEDRARKEILLQYGKMGKTLEICPTANILLTPLEDPKNIPLSFFEENDIAYTINTDNPTLFSTTLSQERKKVGLR